MIFLQKAFDEVKREDVIKDKLKCKKESIQGRKYIQTTFLQPHTITDLNKSYQKSLSF